MAIDYTKIDDNEGFNLKLKSYEVKSLIELLERSSLDANLSQVYADLKLHLFLTLDNGD